MDWSKCSEYFETIVVDLADEIWRCTAVARGRAYHGTRRCSQLRAPGATRELGRPCDDCSGLFSVMLYEIDLKIAPVIAASSADPREHAHILVRRYADQIVISARRRHDAEQGRYSKLSNLLTTKWFLSLVPTAAEQEFVLEVLHFARSGDDSYGDDLPFERIGSRVGWTAVECDQAWRRISEVLYDTQPDFMAANFDRPMVERWSKGLGGARNLDDVDVVSDLDVESEVLGFDEFVDA